MARRKKSPQTQRTLVVVVQDKSGSMGMRREATISGFNEYIDTLRKDNTDEALVTLTQFDTRITSPYTAKPLADVPELTPETYVPGGMTALYDAVGRSIVSTEQAARKDDKILFVIMTDGAENSSYEHTHDAILKLLEDKRSAGWEFIFLGAGEEAWNAGASLGFADAAMVNYSGIDAHDHSTAFALAASTTNSYRRGVSTYETLRSSPVKARLEKKAQDEKKTRR